MIVSKLCPRELDSKIVPSANGYAVVLRGLDGVDLKPLFGFLGVDSGHPSPETANGDEAGGEESAQVAGRVRGHRCSSKQ